MISIANQDGHEYLIKPAKKYIPYMIIKHMFLHNSWMKPLQCFSFVFFGGGGGLSCLWHQSNKTYYISIKVKNLKPKIKKKSSTCVIKEECWLLKSVFDIG